MTNPSSATLKQEHIDAIKELNAKGLCFRTKDGVSPAIPAQGKKLLLLTCAGRGRGSP